jgi:hypothetical protein
MITLRLRARVNESRQLVLTLPPEVQPGEHDIEVTVDNTVTEHPGIEVTLPPSDRPTAFPPRPTNPALVPEHEAFERLLPELMKQYGNKYVAIANGAVIAVADTEVGALTEAHKVRPGTLTLVRRVTDRPQPIERLPSPRQSPTE